MQLRPTHSYTWGRLTPIESLNIDGMRLSIIVRYAAALRRKLKSKPERMIWVDSSACER